MNNCSKRRVSNKDKVLAMDRGIDIFKHVVLTQTCPLTSERLSKPVLPLKWCQGGGEEVRAETAVGFSKDLCQRLISMSIDGPSLAIIRIDP